MQYWFFYSHSYLPDIPVIPPEYYGDFRHEGDWEMCQIAFKVTQQVGDSTYATPFAMTASQHYYGQTEPWSMLEKSEADDNRPVVYVACNSHASYFESGVFTTYKKWLVFGTRPTGHQDFTKKVTAGGLEVDSYSMEELDISDSWWKFPGMWGNDWDNWNCIDSPGAPGAEGTNLRCDQNNTWIYGSPTKFHDSWIDNPHNNWNGDESLRISSN